MNQVMTPLCRFDRPPVHLVGEVANLLFPPGVWMIGEAVRKRRAAGVVSAGLRNLRSLRRNYADKTPPLPCGGPSPPLSQQSTMA